MKPADLAMIVATGDTGLLAATAGTLLSALSDTEGALRDLVEAIDGRTAHDPDMGPYVLIGWIVAELAEARAII